METRKKRWGEVKIKGRYHWRVVVAVKEEELYCDDGVPRTKTASHPKSPHPYYYKTPCGRAAILEPLFQTLISFPLSLISVLIPWPLPLFTLLFHPRCRCVSFLTTHPWRDPLFSRSSCYSHRGGIMILVLREWDELWSLTLFTVRRRPPFKTWAVH